MVNHALEPDPADPHPGRSAGDPAGRLQPAAVAAMEPLGDCANEDCCLNRVTDSRTGLVGRFIHQHESDGTVRVWV